MGTSQETSILNGPCKQYLLMQYSISCLYHDTSKKRTTERTKEKPNFFSFWAKFNWFLHLILFCVCYLFKYFFGKDWKQYTPVIYMLNQYVPVEFASRFFLGKINLQFDTFSMVFFARNNFWKGNLQRNNLDSLKTKMAFRTESIFLCNYNLNSLSNKHLNKYLRNF